MLPGPTEDTCTNPMSNPIPDRRRFDLLGLLPPVAVALLPTSSPVDLFVLLLLPAALVVVVVVVAAATWLPSPDTVSALWLVAVTRSNTMLSPTEPDGIGVRAAIDTVPLVGGN